MNEAISPSHLPVDGFALALVLASHSPVLLLDGSLRILAASKSFETAFNCSAGSAAGQSLPSLGAGEWSAPQLGSLLTATLSGFGEVVDYELELQARGQPPRQLVLNAVKIPHGDLFGAQLLLTISDVTEARLADRQRDDLVREKEVLLREVQHRVANSLQIIASVLMQSARRVQSEETRTELRNAHGRVMSIAAVQSQLSASRLGNVEIKAYLIQLCKSLGASMISDRDEFALDVTADATTMPADTSIRLGLIVTELVINALKHAFPLHRHGTITVTYAADGTEWVLSVVDDGVGMPIQGAVTPGLGTSIVEALAKQLEADVVVTDAKPGASVQIIHRDAGSASPDGVWLV